MPSANVKDAKPISKYWFSSPELPVDQFPMAFAGLLARSPCFRIAWDYHIYAGAREPVAEKRISVWLRHDTQEDGARRSEPLWRLHHQLVSGLHVEAYDSNGRAIAHGTDTTQPLFVEDGAIVFQGGYLEVHDPGLSVPLAGLGLPLGPTQQTHLTHADRERCPEFNWPGIGPLPSNPGRSIHLEVDLAGPVQQPAIQPLLYFPQDDLDNPNPALGAVCLGVEAEAGTRRLLWAISGAGLRSTQYDAGVPELRHTLTVSADYNWPATWAPGENTRAWFELLVDALGLFPEPPERDSAAGPVANATNALRKRGSLARQDIVDFGMGPRKFYIGHAPADGARSGFANEMWSGPFHGRVHRIFFDPTTNCNHC